MYLRSSLNAETVHGTSADLKADYRISIYDCLHALLIPSGNDAAIILATEFGRYLFHNKELLNS